MSRRNMQRKTEELQLAVQEYLDVDWTSVKYYLRRQIAKCVQECKSHASNAKRLVGTMKQGHHQGTVSPNGAYESGDDSDDWGTDFESDFEDDVKNEVPSAELNNNTITQTTGTLEKCSSTSQVLTSIPTHGKFIPKPPDLPVISKPMNGSNGHRNSQNNSIPRPPLKRPPSQPPPPPVPQASSQDEPLEDYEVPIIVQSSTVTSYTAERKTFSFPNKSPPVATQESTDVETYELIEPHEEEYEMVDGPITPPSLPEKPALPPRVPLTTDTTAPPPLPRKPQKLPDSFQVQERPEGVRTFSRPKLPVRPEEESHSDVSTSSSLGSTFFTSLLIKRSNLTPTSSPKSQHRTKPATENGSFCTVSPSEGQSRSSTPDKDVPVPIGNSPFITAVVSDIKKSTPPPLPPRGALCPADDAGQNMATRPLPPVPLPKGEEKLTVNKQLDVTQNPWFHEIEREDAERIIKDLGKTGSFLVRPSKRAGKENPYSITILHEGKLFHLNIRIRSDNTFALGKMKKNEKTFLTVADLIAHHQNEPILLTSRGEPAGTTNLTNYPEKI